MLIFLGKYRGEALKNLQQSCNVVILVITAIDTIKKYSLQIRAIQGWRFFLTVDI